MKNKNQHYIYVAREKNGILYFPFIEFHSAKSCIKYFFTQEMIDRHKNKIFCHKHDAGQGIIFFENIGHHKKIKELKKGEQVRIPINIEKAEVMR